MAGVLPAGNIFRILSRAQRVRQIEASRLLVNLSDALQAAQDPDFTEVIPNVDQCIIAVLAGGWDADRKEPSTGALWACLKILKMFPTLRKSLPIENLARAAANACRDSFVLLLQLYTVLGDRDAMDEAMRSALEVVDRDGDLWGEELDKEKEIDRLKNSYKKTVAKELPGLAFSSKSSQERDERRLARQQARMAQAQAQAFRTLPRDEVPVAAVPVPERRLFDVTHKFWVRRSFVDDFVEDLEVVPLRRQHTV